MIVINTVYLIVDINSERDSIETFIAHTASEAARVVGLAHGLQNLTMKLKMYYILIIKTNLFLIKFKLSILISKEHIISINNLNFKLLS